MKLTKIINKSKLLEDLRKKNLNKFLYNKFFYRKSFRKNIVLESDLELFGSIEKAKSIVGSCQSYHLTQFSSHLFEQYKFELINLKQKPEFLKFYGSNSYFIHNFTENAESKNLVLTEPIRGGFLSLYLGTVGFLPISHMNFIFNQLFFNNIQILRYRSAKICSINFFLSLLAVNSVYILNIPFLTMELIVEPVNFYNRFSKTKTLNEELDKVMESKRKNSVKVESSTSSFLDVDAKMNVNAEFDLNNVIQYSGQRFTCIFLTYPDKLVKKTQIDTSPLMNKKKSTRRF